MWINTVPHVTHLKNFIFNLTKKKWRKNQKTYFLLYDEKKSSKKNIYDMPVILQKQQHQSVMSVKKTWFKFFRFFFI